MSGFTVGSSDRILQGGGIEGRSMSIEKPSISGGASGAEGASFADTLKQAVGQVNELQKASDKSMQNLATGRTDNVADVMITAEKADIALRVMVQVRNKIIDAYNEIMKMQV